MVWVDRVFRASIAFFHGIGTAPNYVFLNILGWFWDTGRHKYLVLLPVMLLVGFILALGGGFLAIFLGLILGWNFAAQKLKGSPSEIEIRW